MDSNMTCIDGDKGDEAQLLGLPLILFDDREDNLVDVIDKGSRHNAGVVVRKGEASHKWVHPRNRHLVINNPHDWIVWCWRFARRFPQPSFIDGPPDRQLEADHDTRSQPFHINNTEPTGNIFIYRRSPYCEGLVRRRAQLESNSNIDSIQQHDVPQPVGSSTLCSADTSALCSQSLSSSSSLQTMSASSGANQSGANNQRSAKSIKKQNRKAQAALSKEKMEATMAKQAERIKELEAHEEAG